MNWAYIAGFFDGEGGIYRSHKNQSDNNYYWQLQIGQKDRLVLEKIKDFVGYGAIYRMGKNQFSSYHILRQQQVLNFAIKIAPYVIVKKEQINYFFKHPWKQKIKTRRKFNKQNNVQS